MFLRPRLLIGRVGRWDVPRHDAEIQVVQLDVRESRDGGSQPTEEVAADDLHRRSDREELRPGIRLQPSTLGTSSLDGSLRVARWLPGSIGVR